LAFPRANGFRIPRIQIVGILPKNEQEHRRNENIPDVHGNILALREYHIPKRKEPDNVYR
jgi:hypothetical protein